MPLAEPGKAVAFTDSLGREPDDLPHRSGRQGHRHADRERHRAAQFAGGAPARRAIRSACGRWPVPPHADARLLGATVAEIDCGLPVNNGPMPLIAKAGVARARRVGCAPARRPACVPVSRSRAVPSRQVTPRCRRHSCSAVFARRSSTFPSMVLSGVVGPDASTICILSGSTKPLTAERACAADTRHAPKYVEKYDADARPSHQGRTTSPRAIAKRCSRRTARPHRRVTAFASACRTRNRFSRIAARPRTSRRGRCRRVGFRFVNHLVNHPSRT